MNIELLFKSINIGMMSTRELNFDMQDLERIKPTFNRSLSASLVFICIAICLFAFELIQAASFVLVVGLLSSWITWPLWFALKKGVDSGRFRLKK